MLYNNMMMLNKQKLTVLFLCTLLLLIFTDCKKKAKKQKIEVNETFVKEYNHTEFIEFDKSHNNYYVFFYSPSHCPKCKNYFPVYDVASAKTKSGGFNVAYARIDADINKELAHEWKVDTEFPTIFWVNKEDDEKVEYHGKKSINGLLNYVKSQLNMTTEELPNYEALTNKKKRGRSLVFVGDISKHFTIYKRLVKIAREEDFDFLYWTKASEFFSKFNIAQDSFAPVVFHTRNKTLDNGERIYLTSDVSRDEIERLFEIYSRPLWGRFDEDMILSAVELHPATPTVFVLHGNNDSYVDELSKSLESLAKKYRQDYWFLNATYDSRFASVFTDVFNIKIEDYPQLVLTNFNPDNHDDIDKYLFPVNTPINTETIENFLNDFKSGKLSKFIYSQKPPTEASSDSIVRVVGSTYNDLVLNNYGKDVVLFLCVNSSKRCKFSRERFVRAANKLANNPNLIFSEIEISFNEFTHINYEKLPGVAIIPGYETFAERVKNIKLFDSDFYSVEIFNWVRNNAKNHIENIVTLENESNLFLDESNRLIKSVDKEKEVDTTSYDEGTSTGLRRTVLAEVDGVSNEDDEDADDVDEEKLLNQYIDDAVENEKNMDEIKLHDDL